MKVDFHASLENKTQQNQFCYWISYFRICLVVLDFKCLYCFNLVQRTSNVANRNAERPSGFRVNFVIMVCAISYCFVILIIIFRNHLFPVELKQVNGKCGACQQAAWSFSHYSE